MLNQFLAGALTIGYFIAGIFFLRFWKKTYDRLFAIFAVAFWVFAAERLALTDPLDENRWYIYLVRLFAFVLIIIAIIDKNRNKAP